MASADRPPSQGRVSHAPARSGTGRGAMHRSARAGLRAPHDTHARRDRSAGPVFFEFHQAAGQGPAQHTGPSDHTPVIVDLDEAPDGDIGPAPPPAAPAVEPSSVKWPSHGDAHGGLRSAPFGSWSRSSGVYSLSLIRHRCWNHVRGSRSTVTNPSSLLPMSAVSSRCQSAAMYTLGEFRLATLVPVAKSQTGAGRRHHR